MCGICGVAYRDDRTGDRDLLTRMNAGIRHRGPDSDGYHFDKGIGLGIRRLAIIDVKGGDQPISNEDNSLQIVLNGEIYNFPELRDELIRRGHHLKTRTDTECVLHYYEDEGDDCIQRLRGMFAFALWDRQRRRLLLARDRLGKKPIYYAVQDGQLYFCSELTPLIDGLPRKPELDLGSIDLYLSLQYIPEPRTVYREVFKLPAAHLLVWEGATTQVRRYWDFRYEPKLGGNESDLASELRDRLKQAVRMRLISEVPLGAHLSGGIDSSIIVALMAELSDAPVKTFSVGFEEENYSELKLARLVAQRYGTTHHEYVLRYGELPQTLEILAEHFGEPFADASSIPLLLLSQITRQTVTVALNGDGGDEDFAGYQRYGLDGAGNWYARLPSFLTQKAIPSVLRGLRDDSDRPTGQSLLDGMKRLDQVASVDPRASILRWSSYFSGAQRHELWKDEVGRALHSEEAEMLIAAAFDRGSGSFLDRTLYADTHTYLPGDLLVKADRMTMAASLEGRSPFLDQELVAWTARLPDSMRLRGRRGKYLLRRAFEGYLPREVLGHRKQGFGIPLTAWFRGPLAAWSRELLLGTGSPLLDWFRPQALRRYLDEHAAARTDHGKRLYALSMLAVWAQNTV